jgi:hypothetical protein
MTFLPLINHALELEKRQQISIHWLFVFVNVIFSCYLVLV